MTDGIPFLSYEDVKSHASAFLARYNPHETVPVPIERIVEFGVGLNIVPFPNLWRDHRLNGFLIRDRSEIWVDQYQEEQLPQKYRFTLAHEVGHYVLHANFLASVPYTNLHEYVEWRLTVPGREIGWMETHADWFAGLVLVPGNVLEQVCRQTVAKHADEFRGMESLPASVWTYISNEIADLFDVSPPVVEASITKEGIPERVKISRRELL